MIFQVSSTVVLTAAQCIPRHDRDRLSAYEFVFGAYDLNNLDHNVQVIGIDEFILHPDVNPFYPSLGEGNMAIAKLSEAVEFNNFVQPVCLPVARIDYEDLLNREGLTAGWGNRSSIPII
jgi:hypothetical protein